MGEGPLNEPFSPELAVDGGQNCLGMVFPYTPGDTVRWTVDAVSNGEVPVFAVYTSENNPLLTIAIVARDGGVLSASALLNGSLARTLSLTSSGW